ncbi:MAG: flavin reductase family protein, partial [Acetobacterium sp.]|nr:flavin reductase family protein [Acetobacterium sp.]
VKPTQGRLNGQIATTVFQVAAQPPLMAVSLNCQNLTHELIQETKKFSVAVISQEAPVKFIGIFGFKCGRNVEKFSGLNYEISPSGTPKLLDYSLAHLDVEVIQTVPLGTHTLFIGQVVDSQVLSEGIPMTYEYYHKIKGGLIQQNAPSYNR